MPFSKPIPAMPIQVPTTPARKLVADFYRAWQGSEWHQPTKREIEQADKLIQEYGLEKVNAMLPTVLKLLKEKWPTAKTFSALVSYMPEAADKHDRQKLRVSRQQEQMLRQENERQQQAEQVAVSREFEAKWRPRWNQLSKNEQQSIRTDLVGKNPWLSRIPSLLEFQCLQELAKRSA
jgi:hypothetical protein